MPQIVLLSIGGIVIGSQGFGLSDPAPLNLIAHIGLGLVFLLAGYELDPTVFSERTGKLALTGCVITAALAAGLVGVLAAVGFVHAFVPVAWGLTTTALGTLLPILREHICPRGGSAATSWLPVRSAHPGCRCGRRTAADSRHRAVPRRAKSVRRDPVARVGRRARPRPDLRATPRARHPDRADHEGRRACHVPDHPPGLHRAAPVPVGGRRQVRSRRGAGCVPGRDGVASVGTR
jgi:hypothetical protein